MAHRPTGLTPVLATDICRRLADGENLRAICRDDGMPSERTVRTWALEDETFAPQYARARAIGYSTLFDQMLEIADTPQIGTKTVTKATGTETIVGDMIEHRRLQVDTRKWMLAKALPKIYGDKVTAEVSGPDGGPIKTEEQTPLELARGIAFILSTAQRTEGT
jgi:hypothetical protein